MIEDLSVFSLSNSDFQRNRILKKILLFYFKWKDGGKPSLFCVLILSWYVLLISMQYNTAFLHFRIHEKDGKIKSVEELLEAELLKVANKEKIVQVLGEREL